MTSADHPDALPGGYRIQEHKFLEVLGVGGFGITYLVQDTLLDRKVAIKEYFPRDFAIRTADHSIRPRSPSESENYTWGLERFLGEARTLAQLNHPGIPRIYKYFETHGSGYIVMEYVEGETLGERLKHENTLDESRLMAILNPLIKGLEQVHATGYLHRDITPKNILLRKDGSPVLIDFGSARQELGAHSRSVTAVVTSGYAPLEQYSARSKQQGPWTDVYGLSAVAYRCITGTVPKDATERAQGETLTSASQAVKSRYTKGLLTAVDQGLAMKVEDRPQDLKTWKLLSMHEDIWGDAEIQSNFGDMHYMGYGVPRSYAEAARWYQLIAEQGDARSQYNLGLVYANGYGVTQDDAEAAKWLQKSAKQGYKKALKWYKRWAERGNEKAVKGDASAQFLLAWMYDNGLGVPQDDAEAFRWYRMAAEQRYRLAAEQGNAWAQIRLGTMYYNGKGVPWDYVEALKWFRLAAEQGNTSAQNNLGVMYRRGEIVPQDDVAALKWFRMAAEQGNASAQCNLGWMYDSKWNDDAGAFRWYRLAAEQGLAEAQYHLGWVYDIQYAWKDHAEAFKWFRMAAEQGLAEAQYALATRCYWAKDYAEAFRWYRMAAEQGDAGAQYKLGKMYANDLGMLGKGSPSKLGEMCRAGGLGVTQAIEAHKWFNLATPKYSDAGRSRAGIERVLSGEAVATAQRLAREWQPKTWDQLKME